MELTNALQNIHTLPRVIINQDGEMRGDYTQLYPTLILKSGNEKPSPNDTILKDIETKLMTQKTVKWGSCTNPVKKFIKKSKGDRKNTF